MDRKLRRQSDAGKARLPEDQHPSQQSEVAPVQRISHGTVQRAITDPQRLTPRDVIALQRTVGNATVQRLLAGGARPRLSPREHDLPVPAPDGGSGPAISATSGEVVQTMRGEPQHLGRDRGKDVIDANERPLASLAVGQGLVVDLGQMVLGSDEFQSCSPIVMFNETTRRGGLFHFPAHQLDLTKPDELSGPDLKEMYDRIKPDQIHVKDRRDPTAESGQSVDQYRERNNDAKLLKDFFKLNCKFGGEITEIDGANSRTYFVTLDGNDPKGKKVKIFTSEESTQGGHLTVTHDRTDATSGVTAAERRAQIAADWQDAPAAIKIGSDLEHIYAPAPVEIEAPGADPEITPEMIIEVRDQIESLGGLPDEKEPPTDEDIRTALKAAGMDVGSAAYAFVVEEPKRTSLIDGSW